MGRHSIFPLNLLFWGASIVCDGPIKLVHCKKTKIRLVKYPQSINMKQNKYHQFYKRGSHMVTERVLVTIRGGNEEGKKMGERKGRIALHGNRKGFDHHQV
jgi:hypothetical protein